jgi:hypothetical protein
MEKSIFKSLCLGIFLLSTTAFSQSGNSINGQVKYHDNFPMSGVTAYLHNSNGDIISTTTTNNEGNYSFNNVAAGNYTVTFTTEESAGGITLTDAFVVMLHLYNLYPFNNIQALASDVDGSGTITWTDYNLILIGYLNQGNPFPVGPWVFEQLPVTVPVAAREGFTTRGGSSGDVNGSLVPDPKNSSISLTNPSISLTARSTDPIEFKLSSAANLNIAGMHLVIKIPDGLSVINVESSVPSTNVSILNNQVRVTWIDDSRQGFEIVNGVPILVITTRASALSRNDNNYSLKLSEESHFINTDGELVSGVTLDLPTINVNSAKDFTVAVYPNPFIENTNINYVLPEDGKVVISLFDQSGKKVKEIMDSGNSAGRHEAQIEGIDLMPGIYHYCIIYTGSDQIINTGTIIKSK